MRNMQKYLNIDCKMYVSKEYSLKLCKELNDVMIFCVFLHSDLILKNVCINENMETIPA